MVLKKDYRFDEVFDIFDEIDINHNKPNEYKARTSNIVNRKNEKLEYLKIVENELTDMFTTSTIIRKINNHNYKGYILEKFKKEFISGCTHHAEEILDSFKFKRLELIKTEEPLESDEVKIVDLLEEPPLTRRWWRKSKRRKKN